MADPFPDIPVGMASRQTDRVNRDRVQYAEGYSQRSTPGLNPITQVWDVVFDIKNEADAATLRAFYEAHITTPFEWTPPGEEESRLWTIHTDSPPGKSLSGFQSYDLTFQFIEEHDLV